MGKNPIDVDVQDGFPNEVTHDIPERIARLLEAEDDDPAMYTRFVNVPRSPYWRLLDWHECTLPPATDIAEDPAA